MIKIRVSFAIGITYINLSVRLSDSKLWKTRASA